MTIDKDQKNKNNHSNYLDLDLAHYHEPAKNRTSTGPNP